MEKFVRFEQFNASDYLASEIILCDEELAEYKIILNKADKLIKTDCGVCLFRHGLYWVPTNKIKSFKSIYFVNENNENQKIRLNLIKI